MLAQGRLRAARDRHHARWERSSCPAAQQSKKQGEIVRRIVESFLVAAGLAFALAAAHGDNYPSRRITLIAPWPPAGAIDTVCRELAPGVADLLGQLVVVENRPGGSSIRLNIISLINDLIETIWPLGTA